MRAYGMIKSDMSGIKELRLKSQVPDSYDMSKQTRSIVDQGNRGICVSVALTDVLQYSALQKHKTSNLPLDYFYNYRKDKNVDGMSVREAVNIASPDTYAKIQDPDTLKSAVIANGPVIMCLPVKSSDNSFWRGNSVIGGHAVVITGWNSDGFIFKNSWGTSYGSSGFGLIPYSDWKYILELWTIF